jgi:UDP-N-acetylmuramate--alanine ligase
MKNYKNIHFIGIGGISMSAIAQILISKGFHVSGSDVNKSTMTDLLEEKGVTVFIGHNSENLKTPDLVVYSSAISSDNPEYQKALTLDIPVLERGIFLGSIMKDYNKATAISGTHGKTTTTGMLTSIMIKTDIEPTILLGGEYHEIKGNVKIGKSDYFLTEACEYKKNFLNFEPYIGTVLNIEEDHLDYFKDLDEIKKTFVEFAHKIPSYGFLVYNGDDTNQENLYNDVSCNKKTFSIQNDAYCKAENLKFDPYPSYKLVIDGEYISHINLKVPGIHNVYNSLAAAACAYLSGAANCTIKKGLESFSGTKRRFEYKGNYKNTIVIDDYAHHPTEIKATLETVSKLTEGKIHVVFQPHTFSRTFAFLDKFSESFDNVENVVIVDIYPAREKNTYNISSKDLVEKLKNRKINAVYKESFQSAADFLREKASSKDIILTLGAGDVYKIGDIITKG